MDKGSGMSFADLIILKGQTKTQPGQAIFERHKSQGQAGNQVFFSPEL